MTALTKEEFLEIKEKFLNAREKLSPQEIFLFDDFMENVSDGIQKLIETSFELEIITDKDQELSEDMILTIIRNALSSYEHSSIRFRKCQDALFDLIDQYGFQTIGSVGAILLDSYADLIINNIDSKDQKAYVTDQFKVTLERILNQTISHGTH